MANSQHDKVEQRKRAAAARGSAASRSRKQKRQEPRKPTRTELPVPFLAFKLAPGASKQEAYLALKHSETLCTFWPKFKYHDPRQKATGQGSFILDEGTMIPLRVAVQIEKDLAPHWNKGTV